MNNTILVGHHDSKRNEILSTALTQQAHSANYDMLTFPITTPHFHSRVLSILSSAFLNDSTAHEALHSSNAVPVFVEPLTPADTQLTPDDSISSIIGVTSTWIDLGSPDPIIADVSRQVLKLELAYAAFCGVSYVIIPGPRHDASCDIAAYARAILDGLSQGPYMTLYLWMQTHPDPVLQREQVGDLATFARRGYVPAAEQSETSKAAFQTWQAWDAIRYICKYSTRLCVALSIPGTLPPPAVVSRWYSEPIRILTLDGTTFAKNAKGYPALSVSHQDITFKLSKLKTQPWLIICDATPLPATSTTPGKATDANYPSLKAAQTMPVTAHGDPHLDYIRHLQNKQRSLTLMDQFGAGYQDYLQAPLQPLTVNLESVTYEVFEKDPIKYEWYERAVARALHDWIEHSKPTSNPDGRVVVAVVGAGRGPLVSRALKAAEDVGVDIDMWALEKNPNAFVLLQRHNEDKWHNQVSLVKSDMRTWQGPSTNKSLSSIPKTYNVDPDELEQNHSDLTKVNSQSSSILMPQINRYKIDILISELLGSFADNELSPECLDGVQHLLNPIHGISIPSSYTAHFTPVAAPKLHSDISLSMVHTNPYAAEVPYVVMLDQVDFLSTMAPQSQQDSTLLSPTKAKSFASLFSTSSSTRKSSSSATSNQTSKTKSATPPPATPVIHTAWSFHHPNHQIHSLTTTQVPTNAHNARYCRFAFPITNPGTCHGLAGYFETVLYPGVELSTNPLTMEDKSAGMISWFPIYFPFKSPVFLAEGAVCEVSMWRMTDDRKVWYEWCMDVFMAVADMKIKVGCTELHSSEKEACLM
ncbi:hypothetical protein LTR05_004451 [Lithohypha guttulata]|uniref:Protein arginine N-methyltransferase n=1 Tax=Lithohypha guttulata TaxID=1690604 RepID=A0AAN7YG06_9EURO|nr:hypothetical protein LTR05_004451 [Lithohypha guttulata]